MSMFLIITHEAMLMQYMQCLSVCHQ